MTHFLAKIHFFLKRKKKKLALTFFIVSVKKHDWMIHENFHAFTKNKNKSNCLLLFSVLSEHEH